MPRRPPTLTPFPYTTLFRSVRAFQLDRRLGERRLTLLALLVDDPKTDQPKEPLAVAVDRLPHEQLERRLGALERIALRLDRKSTRLNSSHLGISYAVFCLKN